MVADGVPNPAAAPSFPFSPGAPLRFLKSKLNTFSVSGPLEETVTEGTPVLLSTVAVGLPRPEAGITKSKTAFE